MGKADHKRQTINSCTCRYLLSTSSAWATVSYSTKDKKKLKVAANGQLIIDFPL